MALAVQSVSFLLAHAQDNSLGTWLSKHAQCSVPTLSVQEQSAVVDLIYMVMSALSTIFREAIKTHNSEIVFHLSQSFVGAALDIATGIFAVRENLLALRILVGLQSMHFIITCAYSWLVIAIFRILIVLFLLRVRSPGFFGNGLSE